VDEDVSGEQALACRPLALETQPPLSEGCPHCTSRRAGERLEEGLRGVEARHAPRTAAEGQLEGAPPVRRRESWKRAWEGSGIAEQLEPQHSVAQRGDEPELPRKRPQPAEPSRGAGLDPTPQTLNRNGCDGSRSHDEARVRNEPGARTPEALPSK
jgi:hypothetical protein